MLDGLRRFFGRAPVGSATLAVRGEVVGLDRPDERRVLSPRARQWSSTRTRDEARNKDVAVVDAILRETAEGRVSRFVDLCSSSRDRDSRLDAVCRTRILAIQGRPFVVRPPPGYEGDKQANENALWVTQHLSSTRGFANLIGHLAHGTLYGHAVLEHDWRYEQGEWRTQPRFVHGNRVGWNTDTEQAGFYESGLFSGNLVPFDRYPSKFILHNPVGGRSSYPWQRGALRSRVIASILKRMGIAWWVKMLERWGQPQVFVTRPPSLGGTPGPDGADEDDDIIAGLRKLSDDWRAVIPNGASIETIAANVHPELHEKFVALQNLEDAVAILGQNLSTEVQGGSFAATKAHQLVRLDVLAADLAELTETITDQWIRLLVEFNRPGTPIPYIDWILAPRGEITVAHFQAGLYSADEVRQSMGHDPETENTGARYAKPEGGAPAQAVGLADMLKAIELAREVGLKPTQASIATLLTSMGIATEPAEAAPTSSPVTPALPS